MNCISGISRGLDVPAPDYYCRQGADDLEEAKGVVCDEECNSAWAVGAMEDGFFDHFEGGLR